MALTGLQTDEKTRVTGPRQLTEDDIDVSIEPEFMPGCEWPPAAGATCFERQAD